MRPMSGWERFLLFVPIPATLGFGLGPLLTPGALVRALGYSGDDPYLTRLAGAATLGYAVGLGAALVRGNRLEARFVAVATFVFGLGGLLACGFAFADGSARPIVSLLAANSLLQTLASGWLLLRFRDVPGGAPNIPPSGVALVVIATTAALVTGGPALLLAQPVGHLLGYRVTDAIVLQLAGAATLGYAAMGALELRSRYWAEMRLPVLMAVVFNGAGLLATLVSLPEGGPVLLPAVVLLATLIVTPGAAIALKRFGFADAVSPPPSSSGRAASG